ncbi:MAG: helix-turn-helix domain-containing protein [Chloroflexota bacterium]
MTSSDARERVLAAAEREFTRRGYDAVTVKDIANAADIHHATIYHHIRKGGKAALYVEVMTRHMARHRAGLDEAVEAAEDDLRAALLGIAAWLLAQPPVDMVRMSAADLPAVEAALSKAEARQVEDVAFDALFGPMMTALGAAQARGEVDHPNMGNVAGAILSSIQGLHTIPDEYVGTSREAMAAELIDVFIRGIAVR